MLGVTFYLGLGEDCCGEDPHPVHGIATADELCTVDEVIDSGGNWDSFRAVMEKSEAGPRFSSRRLLSRRVGHTMGSAGKQTVSNVALLRLRSCGRFHRIG